jgi:hypothetical protein
MTDADVAHDPMTAEGVKAAGVIVKLGPADLHPLISPRIPRRVPAGLHPKSYCMQSGAPL